MIDYFKRYLIYLVSILFLNQVLGLFSDELAEIANSIAHNGIFLSSPTTVFNNSNNFTLITYLLVALKKLLPGYNISGWLMLLSTAFYLSNYNYILSFFGKNKIK